MSRVQKLARGLATGYVSLGMNVLFTLVSVPLALHYLSKAEFGLWILVTQIASYFMLIDFGMSGSVYRIFIDHKDNRADGLYGATFQAGWLAFSVQGVVIAVAGTLASPWVARWMDVEPALEADLRVLLSGQCLALGFSFATKIFTIPLLSHQRQDISNLSGAGQFVVNLAVLWAGFALGCKVYAMLWASVAATLYSASVQGIASWRLGLLPRHGEWGRLTGARFREIFVFGGELFLLGIGWQLISASQVIIIKLSLGLEAVAVWGVCTRVFQLAQQAVWRVLDLAGPALSEMHVRGERDLLRHRLRDITLLSASLAILVGGGAAAINGGFVHFWTHGRVVWEARNDALMALLTISYSVTRCLTLWVGVTKEIRGVRYVYFVEGLVFVAAAWLAAPHFGMTGIIVAALAADVVCCGGYGLFRTASSFQISRREIFDTWLARPTWFFAVFAVTIPAVWWASQTLTPVPRLAAIGAATAAIGAFSFWCLGLPPVLRKEIAGRLFRRAG